MVRDLVVVLGVALVALVALVLAHEAGPILTIPWLVIGAVFYAAIGFRLTSDGHREPSEVERARRDGSQDEKDEPVVAAPR